MFALLCEKLEAESEHEKIGALMGLSFTYAGSAREDILEVVGPMIYDGDNSIELSSVAALVTGIIYIGSCNGDAADTIVQALMERPPHDLNNPHARYMALGLALLYFGKQDVAMASLAAVEVIAHPIRQYIEILIEGCAYACTSNVLKI